MSLLMTRTKIILGVLLLFIVVPSSYAVTLPSTYFDEPCSGNPTNTIICEGVNLVNDAVISLNVTQIQQGIDISILQGNVTSNLDLINEHHLEEEVLTLQGNVTSLDTVTSDNTILLNNILLNSTSFNGTSFLEVDDEQFIQDTDINTLESNVSTLQSTTNTQQDEIDAIHEHIDVVNRNIAIGPLPVPQLETDYTAICNDGSQTKIVGSGVGTLTNGVNTTSNIPELIVGTIANVTVNYTDTRLTFKMTVTNPDDITGLTGEAFLTCVTYPN